MSPTKPQNAILFGAPSPNLKRDETYFRFIEALKAHKIIRNVWGKDRVFALPFARLSADELAVINEAAQIHEEMREARVCKPKSGWKKSLQLSVLKMLARSYKRYLSTHPDQPFILWNGLRERWAILAYLAKKTGNPVYFMEATPFPKHLQISEFGVNAGMEELNTPFPPLSLAKAKALLHAERTRYQGKVKLETAPETLALLKSTDYVFLPLQVPFDTQIYFHGGAEVTSKASYLLALERFISTHPHHQFFFKPHPKDRCRENWWKPLEALPNAKNLSGTDTRDLLTHCKAALTLNSSVGLEAFFFEKPVIALGEAFWKHAAHPIDLDHIHPISDTETIERATCIAHFKSNCFVLDDFT